MKILLPLFLLVMVVVGCGDSKSTTRSDPPAATRWSPTERLNKRRFLAGGLDGTSGYAVHLEGTDEDTLVLTKFTWTRADADKFMSESWSSVPWDDIGMHTVVFRTHSGKNAKSWTYDIPGRTFR